MTAAGFKCPACQHLEFDCERCASCKQPELERARAESEAGQMLNRLLELDFLTERFKVGLEDVTAEEARGLIVLKEERARREREK